METALAVNGQVPEFFTPEQLKMIRDSFLGGASESEARVLLEVAKVRRLSPLTGQIHFIKRRQWDDDSKSYREKWAYQTGIDGLRATAERTGRYDGQDEPEFEYDEHRKLKFARVRVYKKGISRPFVGIAHWSEYAQTKKDGTPTKMWNEKPHIMLAKCAEALGLRKAFPEETSGLYTAEEMGKATTADEDAPAPEVRPKSKAAVQIIDVDGVKVREETAERIEARLLADCAKGWPDVAAKRKWAEDHKAEKDRLGTEAQLRLSKAFLDAKPTNGKKKDEPPHDPQTGEILEPPPEDDGSAALAEEMAAKEAAP